MARWMLLLAPIIYFAHILEEAPGYIRWFNSVVSRPMSDGNLIAMNTPSIAITLLLAIGAAITLRRGAMLALFAWLSYFMLANAIFHIVATLALRRYSPGFVSAVVLYLPYFGWLAWHLRSHVRVGGVTLGVIAAIFGAPMLIQGYLIVFRGSVWY